MNIYFRIGIYAAVIAGSLYAIHWHAEKNYKLGYDAREAIANDAELTATKAALKTTEGWQAAVDEANKRGEDREKKLLDDATSARAAADRLRNENAGLRARIPYITEQAVRQYAAAASVVLDECTERYQSVAADADRFYEDRLRLEEAWPR